MSKRLELKIQPIPERAIVLDTESTGFTPKSGHRMVELAAIELIRGRPTGERFHTYINPCRSVPIEAFNVHGLDLAFLRDKPLFKDIARPFADFVGDQDTPVWAHNATFDQRFIAFEMLKAGLDFPHAFSCSLKLARALPHGAEGNKLGELTKAINYKWGPKGAHSAIEDTLALSSVLTDLLWPLEAIEAAKPPKAPKPRKKNAASPAKSASKTITTSLPEGFQPLTAEMDPRIKRYDDLKLEDRLFARGKKWTPAEESTLIHGFVTKKADIDQLISVHGRTPGAILMKLEALGVVAQGHPYTRT
jgi:DNA polymerase-3 subunit epsilon